MLFHSLNPVAVFSCSLCFFLGGFFSNLLGAGVGDSDYLVIPCWKEREKGSLFSPTVNEGEQRYQEGCWNQNQLFFLPVQIPKAKRESHLKCGWTQTLRDIEYLSLSHLLSSALVSSSGRLLFMVAKWTKVSV